MSENTQESTFEAPLDALISEWRDWKATAAELGVSVSKVRQLIREHQLAAAVPTPGAGQQIPAELVMDGVIVKGLRATITLLSDAGFTDPEIIEWLFESEDSLPGRPITALRENRGREVHRRAQVAGF